MTRNTVTLLGTLAAGMFLAIATNAASDQEKKAILSDEQFTKFVAADAKLLSETLAGEKVDKKTARKILAAAAMISAFAEHSGHADRAITGFYADTIFQSANTGDWKTAKDMTQLLHPKIASGKVVVKNETKKELVVYMYLFASERVGGFAIEQELGNFDEVTDKFSDAQFARLSDLGNKMAVMGKVIERFVPAEDKGAQTKKNWLAFTADFQQTSVSLATAAAAKNEADTRQNLKKLDSSCTNCHDVFK